VSIPFLPFILTLISNKINGFVFFFSFLDIWPVVSGLLVGETLLMSYELDILFGQADSASWETPAEDVVIHVD